jgi:hypothetical protein
MQALDLVDPVPNILEPPLEAFPIHDCPRGLQYEHRVRPYVMVDLARYDIPDESALGTKRSKGAERSQCHSHSTHVNGYDIDTVEFWSS